MIYFSRNNKLILCIFILLLGVSSFAQNPNELIKVGDVCMDKGDHYGALLYYKQAFEADSGIAEFSYKYAEALRLTNNYKEACYYYQKTYKKEKGKFYPLGQYYIALMQKYCGHYDESKASWKTVKNRFVSNKKSYQYLKAIKEIEACEKAKKIIADTLLVKVENMGSNLNSSESEFGAFEYNDDTLFFNSLRGTQKPNREVTDSDYAIKIYMATKNNGDWSNIKTLKSKKNQTGLNIANGCYNKDNKIFLYTECDKNNNCKIYKSKVENGILENGVPLDSQINLEGTTSTQPNFGLINGKEVLFFVSNRLSENFDIWYSYLDKAQTFSDPINAGLNINTSGNEVTPYFNDSTGELFFSSDWHSGLGGYDIFKSNFSSNQFSQPENLGVPFNSSTNDLYYNENLKHTRGYLTSNRENGTKEEEATCCNDIYYFDIDSPKKSDTNQEIESFDEVVKYLPVKLYFHNDEPNPRTNAINTKLTFKDTYEAYANRMNEYILNYGSDIVDTLRYEAQNKMRHFFETDLTAGMEQLEMIANLLSKELEQGKKIDLTLKGFASPLAKSDYNISLTKRRISSVINFFKSYNNNTLLKYINETAVNGAKLNFIEIPFGEYKSSNEVSDNLNDLKNSVYSLKAINERKIEIVSIKYSLEDSLFSNIKIENEILNFGYTAKGKLLSQKIKIYNSGNTRIILKDPNSSYDCIKVSLAKKEIMPKEETEILIHLETKDLSGKNIFSIDIETEDGKISKEINLTVEVE